MDLTKNDEEFVVLINEIINDSVYEDFKNIKHHGITRFEHSLRVAYYSYLITKKLNLNYNETTRAALLHDFHSGDENELKNRFRSFYRHPKVASKKANFFYDLTPLEIDIIEKHMFPANLRIPKYKESWIVSFVDKGVATFEFVNYYNLRFKFSLTFNAFVFATFASNMSTLAIKLM